MAVGLTVGPEVRLLNLHFFNIWRHHPTLKFKPHATDDERYVSGIDGVPLIIILGHFSELIFQNTHLFCKFQFTDFKSMTHKMACS